MSANDPGVEHRNPASDIMNDPQYATNTVDVGDVNGEPDTCRICRAEAVDGEPLFYPCKCSGSIKFVHQDCLMEWLSHSQKKHCELCKTPFRFTKLYSPNMPQSLPMHVFLRHFAIHTAKNLATYLRFCLVVMVWLVVLPWITRQLWRLLFWLSDGGWPTTRSPPTDALRISNAANISEVVHGMAASLPGNGTSPATPLHAQPTSSASLVARFIEFLMPYSQSLSPDLNGSYPLIFHLLASCRFNIESQTNIQGSTINASGDTINATIIQSSSLSPVLRRSTLLSEVSFLRNLTRSPTLNSVVIEISEGYIITVLVVVSFILVFLIREWVVQQQPGINMGAAFNADMAGDDGAENQEPAEDGIAAEIRQLNEQMARNANERPIARPRRMRNNPREGQNAIEDAAPADNRMLALEDLTEAERDEVNEHYQQSPTRRPSDPEVQMSEEFSAIWRRAEGDPREVLEIIDREGLRDRMQYWADAMNARLRDDTRSPELPSTPANPANSTDNLIQSGSPISSRAVTTEDIWKYHEDDEGSSSSNNSWQQVQKPDENGQENMIPPEEEASNSSLQSVADGKRPSTPTNQPVLPFTSSGTGNNVRNETEPPAWVGIEPSMELSDDNRPSTSSSLRQRSVSDVPHLRQNKSPLAQNSWSFSNLPDEDLSDQNMTWARDNKKRNDADVMYMARKAAEELDLHHGVSADYGVGSSHAQTSSTPQSAPIYEGNSDSELRIVGEDGVVRVAHDWEDVFSNNPISDDEDEDDIIEAAEANPFAPDTPLPQPREPVLPAPRPAEPQGALAQIADWLWGGADGLGRREDIGANDEHVVEDLAAEAPFVPVVPPRDAFGRAEGGNAEQDREVLDAAIAAGIDPNDADPEDPEDFDGIMELIGMRGPMFGLFQNAIFSCFLLALTVAIGVWIPYNIGRISLLLLANPGPALKLPLRLIFGCAAFLQDCALMLVGGMSYCLLGAFQALLSISILFNKTPPISSFELGNDALKVSQSAFDRVMNDTVETLLHVTDSEIFTFSAASHEALLTLKSTAMQLCYCLFTFGQTLIKGHLQISIPEFWSSFTTILGTIGTQLVETLSYLARPESWVISLEVPKRLAPLNPELSFWSGLDRFWAILAGYTTISFLGALYVKRGVPFSEGAREAEATIIDLLNQAGGVMKVILIISIEMLVFPLYCGLLLDLALLPLFEGATIVSRIEFTARSPLTSIFVHWFVGTCYMFHFALFVSMCRKIMRKGVLYFIRDPDDPTFHPVRDVLERNVATQLRKILFSALVYGALVVICLGGVVWGLAMAFRGVLPIHWSSNEPVLEFPIDLLFYNFLMPLAVKFFKPSDGLHLMYSWWFRRCARMLRLTWFMFDERKPDEEGHLVRRSWTTLVRSYKDCQLHDRHDVTNPFDEDQHLQAYLQQDGRYVRAPASDQVRLPKGSKVFLEVDQNNIRLDGSNDSFDGVHGRNPENYKLVYVPPWFRLRISIFILSVWFFAAFTGVCTTIVPLVFGRHIFAKFIPADVRKNDIYAFSIGIYILGSALYAVIHLRASFNKIRSSLHINGDTPGRVFRRIGKAASRLARIVWTWTAFIFILPTLFAFLIEFYFIVPLHTYFAGEERHIVHFVQSWTLGLLYVKLTTRIILWNEGSRPAEALRAITRNGYFNPDARLATRSFILPAGLHVQGAPWSLVIGIGTNSLKSIASFVALELGV
ncbi:hypothetical protein CJF32_00002552 [Rutstroemia sp. NJR-2017a WRK4]|nr:hypothetical protein CJF32_00007378 [Rutstroemia sp. NJR-2017a WRK4]PQE11725.1 hypothetical protein CJF32_00002552 [Rutstroemia sp. NJR-2017a WRK4]